MLFKIFFHLIINYLNKKRRKTFGIWGANGTLLRKRLHEINHVCSRSRYSGSEFK